MRRGTTPVNIFKVELDLRNVSALFITYKQGDEVVLEKSKADLEVNEKDIRVRLTQAETLLFDPARSVYIQIRYRDADGNADASNIMKASVGEILKEGEI